LNLGKKDSIQNKLEKKLKEDLKFTIPVDWESISKDAKSATNVCSQVTRLWLLHSMKVKVTGNVLLTSEIPYRRGKGFDITLGGLDNKGWKKSYIIYPNGKGCA
jgi:hypothetical protein